MNQSQGKWFFIKEDPNDRVRSTVRQHALGGSELSHEARVVREAIQNSVDATNENQKTNISVWNKTVYGDDVDVFRDLIGFGNSDSPFVRLDHLGLQPGNALESMSSNEKADRNFNVTIIEDLNTCGLGYDEDDGKDRFDELCLSYGQDYTVVDPNRGGSYGFGKSVYEEASDCNMFIVYSVFKPNPSTAPNEVGSHARLFACATFKGHELGKTKYRGRALFGVFQGIGPQTQCRPIVDEQAHEMAQQLGFPPRNRNDTGTSIMIVGSHVETATLKMAIEDWWWPRLYSNQLSVELWANDDEEGEHPDPKSRKELRPYLRGYSLIEEGIAKDDTERLRNFRSNNPLVQQGKLALIPMPQVDDKPDESEQDSYLENTIALIRSGPRMVVKYLDPSGKSTANFAGVFVSHPEVETELHLSEPSAHDDWSPQSVRFNEAYPDNPERQEQARRLVKTLMDKIRNAARAFRRELVPTTPPTPITGSRTLQNMLARIMSGGSSGPPPPPPPPDPFTINIQPGRKNTSQNSQVTAMVDIALNDRSPTDAAEATLTIEPYLTVDDDIKRDSQGILPLRVAKLNGADVEPQGNSISLTIKKETASTVEIASERFPRGLYAGLDVNVKIDSLASSEDDAETTDST